MKTVTVLWILLAAIVSLCLVLFQYFYQGKRGKLQIALGFLRFVVLFSGFLLLINPKFIKEEYRIEKANLIVVADNSSSIKTLQGTELISNNMARLKANDVPLNNFNISYYLLGNQIIEGDSLTFEDKTTNISETLNTLNEIYGDANSALVLLTDGNQTLGLDYEFLQLDGGIHVFPIVAGDTTNYEDLKVDRVNANKYAFLRNKFPIETSISYAGSRSISSIAKIYLNGQLVFRQPLNFNKNKTSARIETVIEANSVGVKNLSIRVDALENEKNTINNSKEIALEVIDEKTNIALVSSILHPDIGALKKAIEANEQRVVTLVKPNASIDILENSDVFVLYQPNSSFKPVYDFIEKRGAGLFTITGSKTDWNFLNKIQTSFSKESYNQKEEILPVKNAAFSFFDISELAFDAYPPLDSELGDLIITKPYEVIANQRTKGVDLNSPLLLVTSEDQAREAVLFGENIWKWRAQTYRNDRSFKTFDDFMGKLIFYLSDVKQKSRLSISYENLYDGSTNAKISASYFDNSYTFDPNASLNLKLTQKDSGFSREFPMLLNGNKYEVSLDGLTSGNYQFSVSVAEENLSKSGQFTILDFNLEDQFLAADYQKLDRFAERTGGRLYYPDQISSLIEDLAKDNRFKPIQKSNRNVVSLIDFRFLLVLMILVLAAEWMIRKYNGLL